LLGWDYPANAGLKDIIDRSGLYPITCLTSLSKSEKQQLLDMKIVLCSEIQENDQFLKKVGVKDSKLSAVKDELEKLCGGLNKNIS
jgi:predicted nuclease with TOPRIM domain